jgi:hypothetical protein
MLLYLERADHDHFDLLYKTCSIRSFSYKIFEAYHLYNYKRRRTL